MEDRTNLLMNFILNDQRHLKRFVDFNSPFKQPKKNQKPNVKPLLKNLFYCFSKQLKQFKCFFFELYPNMLVKYQDKTKAPPIEYCMLQNYQISEENEAIGESIAFGILIENDDEITKLVTDKFQIHKVWCKNIRKYCKLQNFIGRYRVDVKLYEHFYRCVDKKKKIYTTVKIVNKKDYKSDIRMFIEQEISIMRRIQAPIIPPLKKIYEDESYIYLTYHELYGEDLRKLIVSSSLEEIAIATLAYHILKGLKALHLHGVFHGNLKLENIIFSSNKKANQIFFINYKYSEEFNESYRERLIKKGFNDYIAPEVLENKPFNQQIDLFAVGVSLYFMVFGRFPYSKIVKENEQLPVWNYHLDLDALLEMQREKKKNPSCQQPLSASGIDIMLRLLEVDQNKRPSAKDALNHPWFINFTNKPSTNQKLQKFKDNNSLVSLRTILECSEVSEREFDSRSILFNRKSLQISMFNDYHSQSDNDDDDDENNNGSPKCKGKQSNNSTFLQQTKQIKKTSMDSMDEEFAISEENNNLMYQMHKLNKQTYPKFPTKTSSSLDDPQLISLNGLITQDCSNGKNVKRRRNSLDDGI